ncbi:MAG: hypothetical protein WAV11_01130 [Minisyncoccia bacterium]
MNTKDEARKLIIEKEWDDLHALIDKNQESLTGLNTIILEILPREVEICQTGIRNYSVPNETPISIIEFALGCWVLVHNVGNHANWLICSTSWSALLWQRKNMEGWIKKFNDVAFDFKNGCGGGSVYVNCERLVYDVLKYGSFNTDPKILGITPEHVAKVLWGSMIFPHEKDKLEAMPFDSQLDADIWDAKWYFTDISERCTKWNDAVQQDVPDIQLIKKCVEILQETCQMTGAEGEEILETARKNIHQIYQERLTELEEALKDKICGEFERTQMMNQITKIKKEESQLDEMFFPETEVSEKALCG